MSSMTATPPAAAVAPAAYMTLSAPRLPRATARAGNAAATAQSFEAVFVGQMIRIMMDTAPADGPFTGGHGEEMFRGVLAEKMGDAIAARGGFGLAPAVMTQILRMQGATA